MPKKGKLLAALDAAKGVDYEKKRQKSLQKRAAKLHAAKLAGSTSEALQLPAVPGDGVEVHPSKDASLENGIHDANGDLDVKTSPKESSDDEEEEEEEEPVPFSDIESMSEDEKEDIVPFQRLTINNTSALLKAHKSIALDSSLPFHTHQTVISAEQIHVPDAHDDLTRELAFYQQSLDAAVEARRLLREGKMLFTRPNEYFAEMVKTDEHMGKIKSKMVEEAANKKAATAARKQRDLKKFGKQVQVAKLQERDRMKKDTLNKINILKRKRKEGDTGKTTEEDLFDVALENETRGEPHRHRSDGNASGKRQKKDAKYGFGGRKRFAKSGDAISSGDLRGFSSKRMKNSIQPTKRLGKSRRQKAK